MEQMTSQIQLLAQFKANPPAHIAAIRACEDELRIALPDDYIQFLLRHDGGEGFIGNWYAQLWPVGDLVKNNIGYGAPTSVPGILLFGSNGGGEAFAYDAREQKGQYLVIPFIVLHVDDAIGVGPGIDDFLKALYFDTVFGR